MTTEAQINANRQNAKQSTGPRTEEGKARTHLNALKHGRRAKLVVLPWENQDDFDDLCDEFEDGFKPANVGEQAMVEKMVVNYWKVMHLEAGERSIHIKVSHDKQRDAMSDLAKSHIRFDNAYMRAQEALMRLQAHRIKMDKYERSLQPQSAPQNEPLAEKASEASKVNPAPCPPPPAPASEASPSPAPASEAS